MRVAIVGCGSIGQRHTRNLVALGVDVIAFDPAPERLAEAASLGAHAAPSMAALFATRPDAAFVCTPPVLHAEGLSAALDADCDLLIEKPIATRVTDVASLLSRAEGEGRIIAVGYNFRFNRGLLYAKGVVDGGSMGRPLVVRAEFGQYLPDWRPTRDYRTGYNASARLGGGVFLDQSHEIDYVRWMFGDFRAVSAMAGHVSDLDIDVEDVALIHARIEGGPLAEIHLDSVRRGYRRTCTIIGTEGTVEWDLRRGVRIEHADGRVEQRLDVGDVNDMYVDEVRDFLDCVRTRRPPRADGRTGLRVLEITEAARQSAADHREVNV